MINCLLCIDQLWLPTKGTDDAVLVSREMAIDAGDRDLEGQIWYQLLVPSEDVGCPQCFDIYNDDLVGVQL